MSEDFNSWENRSRSSSNRASNIHREMYHTDLMSLGLPPPLDIAFRAPRENQTLSSSPVKYKQKQENGVSELTKESSNIVGVKTVVQNTGLASINLLSGPSAVIVDERQKLISQNKKLKQQVKDLASTMQMIIAKDREYREQRESREEKQKNLKKPAAVKEVDIFEQLRGKKEKLAQHHFHIHEMKANLTLLKRQMEVAADFSKILEREDELRGLKKEHGGLLEEREQLLRQKQIEMSKSAKYSASEEEYEKQIKALKEQIKRAKEDNKDLLDKLTTKEKSVKRLNELSAVKDDRIRDINNRIKERNKILEHSDQSEVSDEVIAELGIKIKELEAEKKRNEVKFAEEITHFQKERIEIAAQYEKRVQTTKERERTHKLNQIKVKEILKLIKANQNNVRNYSRKTPQQIEELKNENANIAKYVEGRLIALTEEKEKGQAAGRGRGEESVNDDYEDY